uniref:DUF5641 domain-containing protein n=2 Tax=Loa loa TaxID=7209 RepID=A0A1I7W241_LOALO
MPGTLNARERLIKYWMTTLKVLDTFWELWKTEYLTSLSERTQKEHVEVTENHSPRGKDGVTRAVVIETPYRKLTRPINMLYPLEANIKSDIEREETKNKPENAEEPIALRTGSTSTTKKLPSPALVSN